MRPGPGSLAQSSDQTEQYLKALKLQTFLREHDKVSRQCAAEGVGHPDFLLRLSELELIDRHHHMVDRRIKAARFPTVKSLDSFDFLTFPSLNKALVHELIEARDEIRLLNMQKRLANLKLLIIDELGFVPLSKTGAELLFEVFGQRYERGSIVVPTNLPFDERTEVFGSESLTGALLDRLTHHAHILKMNGDSYRLRQSRKTNKNQTEHEA
jgi:DNA replication protein DnaC